jgi:hypothetical protein
LITLKENQKTLKNGINKPQFMNSNNTKPVIVFDVNETLLDMAPLKITSIAFEEAFEYGYGATTLLVENCTSIS